jgi:hypothetical protein
MAATHGEEETVFSSKVKYNGIFSLKDFYQFCYDWLTQDPQLDIQEKEYSEKLAGDAKNIDIKWTGTKKVTDYFQFKTSISFRIQNLTSVEVIKDNVKMKTNNGSVEISIKGILMRDYQGKYDESAFRKFLRGIYEKWVIPSRINEFEGRLITICDNFLGQAKAWLDLEGRR